MKEILIAYQGEMALKGLNRNVFENKLMQTMRRRLKPLGSFRVYNAQSTMYAEPLDDGADMDAAFLAVSRIFGIAALSRAAVVEKDFGAICETARTYLADRLTAARTFKVAAKRSDKSFSMNSMEIAAQLGGYLLEHYPHLRVDVKHPELTVMVEVRDFGAYVHGGKQPGAGGLPVGSSGKAAVMLSGGIDSPVAAYMMAKRGLALMGVHFASPPYTSERAKMKVITLSEKVEAYCGPHLLCVVPFTDVQLHIRDNAPTELFTLLLRRSMMRITETLGRQYGCDAIVTGESLAQVASQTTQAIGCTDLATQLPVLRPLIGMDKNEIVEIARRIDTFETSILPYEDCCTIFTPAHPKTRPHIQEILAAEAGMDLAPLEEAAVQAVEKIRIQQG